MTPSELSQCLETLRAAGLTNEDFARLHHFSEKGRKAYLSDAISYFRATMSLKRNNLDLAERCMYVGGQFALDRTDKEQVLSEALAQWPLNQGGLQTPLPVAVTKSGTRRGNERRATTRPPSKKLGDDGEELAVSLLGSRGYTAELLSKNFPTYDIQASGESNDFLVSVKVARLHQHLRLGSRNSVSRLSDGNFILAFLANPSSEVDLVPGGYRLLILPAAEVRDYALSVHDAYWAAKGKADGFSVMIKAYDPRHIDVWQRWTASYQDAWHQLPTPKA